MISRPGKSKREVLIEAAMRLFEAEGFRAVGIDRIVAEAGVAKMTLYNHFRTKDELILAVIRRKDEQFRNWLMREVEKRGGTARERLMSVFDVLGEWYASPGFAGCPFARACDEFEDSGHPVRSAAREHNVLVRGYLAELVRGCGVRDVETVAEQVLMVIAGATERAQQGEGARSAEVAKKTVAALMDSA